NAVNNGPKNPANETNVAVYRLSKNPYKLWHMMLLIKIISNSKPTKCGQQFTGAVRSEEHTSELQSLAYLVCRLLLEKKKKLMNSTLSTSPNSFRPLAAPSDLKTTTDVIIFGVLIMPAITTT